MRFLSIVVNKNNHNIIRNNCRRFATLNQQQTDSSAQPVDLSSLRSVDKDVKKKSNTLTKKASKKSIEKNNLNKDELDKHTHTTSDLSDSRDKAVVLRKPIPKNFIKETLLPHLEHNVAYNCMKFPPDVILQIGIAYSKLPHFIRQRSIEDALVEGFRYRMVDYTAVDCIQLLNTCFQLQGLRSIAVYDDIISRLEVPHVYNSINSLNRLGICRSISKIVNHSFLLHNNNKNTKELSKSNAHHLSDNDSGASSHPDKDNSHQTDTVNHKEGSDKRELDTSSVDKNVLKYDLNAYHDLYKTSVIRPWSYFVKNYRDKKMVSLVERMVTFCENRILPQLEYELKSFDPDELTDLLAVLAQRTERDGSVLDFPVISILMSNIMRLYSSTSLVNSLNNLSSLCRLRIRHDEFIALVLNDLRNPLKVTNIYHKHLSRCVWSLARFDLLNDVFDDLMPHISQNVPKFSPSCFARLSQVSAHYPFSSETKANRFKDNLMKMCLCILTRIDTFSPKDMIFLTSALMNTHLLPTEAEYGVNASREVKPKFEKEERYLSKLQRKTDTLSVLSRLLGALDRLESEFDLLEIERLIATTRCFDHYKYLLDRFPESWHNIIHPPETSD